MEIGVVSPRSTSFNIPKSLSSGVLEPSVLNHLREIKASKSVPMELFDSHRTCRATMGSAGYNEKPLNLVLDIDETLLTATDEPIDGLSYDFRTTNGYYVYKRPGLDDFLSFVQERKYSVGVWTSAGSIYAKEIAQEIFKSPKAPIPRFIWSGDKLRRTFDRELQEVSYVKDLKKLRKNKTIHLDLTKTLAIDDSPYKHVRNYGNLIRVNPFYGDPQDVELRLLMQYLPTLERKNVRAVEKRGWQSTL